MKSNKAEEKDVEILKAVAQAWHGHSGRTRPTNKHDACLRNFHAKPSRFKLEALNNSSSKRITATGNWDFTRSLLDSYEIVSVVNTLEKGLGLDDPFSGLDKQTRVHRRRRESSNSLRNLFNRLSSRRFDESDIPRSDNT